MRNLTPSDHMTGSAKRAIDTALSDAARQRVDGGAAPVPTPTPAAKPSQR